VRAQFIFGNNQVAQEHDWPDDLSAESIKHTAFEAFANDWEDIDRYIKPKPNLSRPAIHEVRVLDDSGNAIKRHSLLEYAKSLGKELWPPSDSI
jgi:hypothetical protein